MTNLIETVTVTFTINHCTAQPTSSALGGPNDIRLYVRTCIESVSDGPIKWQSTGLEEIPEMGADDN